MELAQMEVTYPLSVTMRGEAALNETDRQHIHRYMRIDVAVTTVLRLLAPPRPSRDLLSYDRITVLAGVRKRPKAAGVEVYTMNLTRPALGITVTPTIAPCLEIGLTSPPGPRLCYAAERSGADPTRAIVL
jgi:hypothetical protein